MLGALLGSFRLPVSKADKRGTNIATEPHPAGRDFLATLGRAIDNFFAGKTPAKRYVSALNIRQDTFSLVYADFSSDTPEYDLTISTTAFRKPDSAGWFSAATSIN